MKRTPERYRLPRRTRAGGPVRFDDHVGVQKVVVAGEQKPVRSTTNMRSVLLVDDTPVIRHLAQHVLEEAGYDAHSAEDGVAALGFSGRVRCPSMSSSRTSPCRKWTVLR